MLKLFQSFFGARETADAPYPDSVIEAAIEHALDGTDPRIRALPGYRARLRGPILAAIDHVVRLVDTLPPPVAADSEGYRSDALLRAMFASFERLQEVLGHDRNLEAARAAAPGCGVLTGLLVAELREKHVLGLDLDGDMVRREVRQTVLSFDAHRFVDPAQEEAESRRLLKRRAFDHILAQVLADIGERRMERQELGAQRALLARKLELLRGAGWSLGDGASDGGSGDGDDSQRIELELAEIEGRLEALGPDTETLETHLGMLADALAAPAERLYVVQRRLALDHRNVLREGPDPGVPGFGLGELRDATGRTVVLRLLAVDPDSLPRRDFFKAASRYL